MATITSREFNQDVSRAKRAADKGPVIITDRGRPAYVLMKHETYRKMAAGSPTISALLFDSRGSDIDFEPPRLGTEVLEPGDDRR